MHEDIAARILLAPDRPWPVDEGLLQLAGLTLNLDPVLQRRGRDERYWEQLRAEVPSVASAMDARRRRVIGAAMETVPGRPDDPRAELYADFIRTWRAYVGQGPAPSWRSVLSAMWHAAAWGWRPARLSWVGIEGAPASVRPFAFQGRTGWRVPWRIAPLDPSLYAWTADGELVELIIDGGFRQAARVIPHEIDAVSHWHVRAGASPSPYGIGFLRYAEGPAFARRKMWARYQEGVNMAMGGWRARRTAGHIPVTGTGQAGGVSTPAAQVSSLVSAFAMLSEARVFVEPPGWDLQPITHAEYTTGWLEGIEYVDKFLSMMIRGSLISEIGGTSAPGSRAAAETLNDGLEGAVAADDAAFLCDHVRALDRVVLEANFGQVPDDLVPIERIHAGPRAPVADVVALATASAAAGIEPDWEQLYTSLGIPHRSIEAVLLDDRSTAPIAPAAGVVPRMRSEPVIPASTTRASLLDLARHLGGAGNEDGRQLLEAVSAACRE